MLTISIPFFLITGPFLADLAVTLCAILFLINSLISKYSFLNYYKSIFFKIFIIFWLILVFSSFFSNNIFYSLSSSLPYLRFGFFTLSTWYLLDCNKNLITYIFYVFIICFLILILDGYLQFFTKKNFFGWEIIDTRVSSFFKNELVLGSYLSRLYPIFFATFIWKYLNDDRKLNFYILLVFFVLIEVLIFISGERVAFFYLNLSTFLIIALAANFKFLRLASVILSIIFILLISHFKPVYFERVVNRTLDQIIISTNDNIENKNTPINPNNVTKKNSIVIFSQEHQDHYESAWRMFNDNKFFGIGTKLFRKNCNEPKYKITFESCTTHPHNTYIQLLAENGLIGFGFVFSIFLVLIFYCLKHFYLKIFRKKIFFTDYQVSLLTAFVITLWPFAPTGNFLNNWLSVIYFLPIGFFLWSFKNR